MKYHRIGRLADLKGAVLQRIQPWAGGSDVLFDGTVRSTERGRAYIPAKGQLPRCSTGYWVPDADLVRHLIDGKARFRWTGESPIQWIGWVGVADPPAQIPAGSLVRVSLGRLFCPAGGSDGYYMQISGVL